MALVVKDRVKEITTTTGTSNLTLGGAVFGFQSFSVVGNGNQTYYAIYDSATGDWEVGVGTYSTTGPTLSRDTVLESSNSGSKVVLAAGTKDVFLTYPAERSVYLDTAGSAVTTLDIGTLGTSTANITTANITAGTISTTPTSSNDLVNKTYVDGIAAQGITYHTPVKYEVPNTTGNLNATYNNGASGVGATLTNAGTLAAFAPDGPTASPGDRILVYNQTNAAHNGVYTVTTVGSGSVAWVLTRAADANSYGLKDPNALGSGDAFFVTSGNTGAGETYVCNTSGTITFGTTAITFAQIASAQIYSAGAGLTLSNLVFSLTPVGTAGTYGSASSVPVFTTNAYGQITSTTNTAISISAGAVSGLAPSATTDTTNASNITSGTLPVARLSGSYTGITGVGTLAAGTWNASTIGATFGGTGLTTYAQGDLLYATSSTTLGRLADVATGNALISGGVGADPSWGKIGLQTHVSGTLQVANGGTGATTLTGYVYGNGTGAFTASTSIPNSATTATSANTASAIVARDASGNFSAGTITASLSGNASTATSATSATTATNLAGGVAGAIPYQSAGGTTLFSAAGTSGQYLQSNGTSAPSWSTLPAVNNGTLTMAVSGTGLSGSATFTANQSGNSTFTVTSNATNANTASTIVARDASGNFSAGTITAALSGNATTATTATQVGNSVTFNNGGSGGASGSTFNGSGALTVSYNTVGAPSTTGTNASGTWGINITGNAATATTASNVNNGTLTLNVSGTGLSGSQTFTANQASNATFTVTSNATSANTASTIVARDASGNFSAGTITASLSGNASTATTAGASTYLITQDIRTLSPSSTAAYRLGFGFTSWANNNTAPYADYLALRSYSDASGGNDNLLLFNKSTIAMRLYQQSFGSASAYASYADVLMSNNYNSYAPTLTGGGASGTWGINITGNAATATTASNVNNGTLTLNVSGTGLSGSQTFTANQAGNATFTVTSNATNANTASTIVARDGSGNFSAGTITAALSGNASTATALSSGQSNWSGTGVLGNVVGLLAWKNYSNNHVIFDASNSTTPSGTACSNTNAANAWTGTYPTLMGWNGSTTYGVRVDSARVADSAGSVDYNNLTNKTGGTGTYTTSGDYRAPIFYDSNNTAYYVDPASGSNLNGTLTNSGGTAMTAGWNRNLYLASTFPVLVFGSAGTKFSGIGVDYSSAAAGFYFWVNGSSADISGTGTMALSINTGNFVTATGSFRAPIFYDSNDTTYYIDPASFTNVFGGIQNSGAHGNSYIQNRLLAANNGASTGEVQLRMWCSEPGITWDWAGFGYNVYNDGGSPGGFGRPNTNFGQAYMRFGTSGDLIFYNTTTGASRSTTMQLHSTGYVTAFQSSRAPIFYDTDNTGYYADPASTSNFVGLTVANTISGSINGNAATATTATTANALNTGNNYQVNSLGVGTAASGTAGEIRATNNVTAYYSDDRLKNRLGPIEDALAKVLSLEGFYYEANELAQSLGYVPVREVGLSAQQTQRVLPEVVVPAPIDDRYLTMRYERVIPLLVEAIKELSAKVDALR